MRLPRLFALDVGRIGASGAPSQVAVELEVKPSQDDCAAGHDECCSGEENDSLLGGEHVEHWVWITGANC